MKKTQHETVVSKLAMLGTGLLLLGFPFALANSAFAAPTPKFAYVANLCPPTDCTVGSVSAYTIDSSTGALSAVVGSPFAAGTYPISVAVDPTNRFAYVANECASSACFSAGTISAFTVDSSTGALRPVAGSPFAAGNIPISVAVDPTGRFAYVVNDCLSSTDCSAGNVSAYTINSATGALRAVAGSPFAAGNSPISVMVDPSGRFAYVANACNECPAGSVSAYSIDTSTGALKTVSGSPFAAGPLPEFLTVDPSGRFVYVANIGGNVSAYTIDNSTGALKAVAGSPFTAGNRPYSVAVDPSGRFVYVANYGGDTVSAYAINGSTGALRAIAGSPFAAGFQPISVTADPSGRFAYVVNECHSSKDCSAGNVSAYTINSATGALRAVAGSPFAAGDEPVSVAIAGRAATTSVLTLTPRSLAFGNLPIHTSSAAQSVTVTNTSANDVPITGIALRGTAPKQFTFTNECGPSLAAHAICTLEVQFAPSRDGAMTAYLDVNGGGGGLRSVKLTGTGTSSNPWVGSWDGKIKSTCGYISGPFDIVIESLGKNRLSLADNYGDQYDLTISATDPNVATSAGGVVRYTINGNSMRGREPNSCQTA